MSLEILYQWHDQIAAHFPSLGHWQSLSLALYSLGMVLARHNAATRVAESLGMVGKPESVRRRLERLVAHAQVHRETLGQHWIEWLLRQAELPRPILLVDETKLGPHLRVMVVGLAYQSCCIPLAFRAYVRMPCPQVELITALLTQIALALPDGCQPLLQADRGLGTSPALIRAVEQLDWHYLFRVQNTTHLQTRSGHERPLHQLVQRGECWSGSGLVFKKAGWLPATVLVIWDWAYADPWCLVTNAPYISTYTYGVRYWQEAGFRDLKSDGWQWQSSRVWTPAHAEVLLLVMALAYTYTLTLGSLVLNDPALFCLVGRYGKRQHFSIFRLGLRLFDYLAARQQLPLPRLWVPCPLRPDPLHLGVGV